MKHALCSIWAAKHLRQGECGPQQISGYTVQSL